MSDTLERTTITVHQIVKAEGRKSGKIKADDGTWYGAWPDKMAMFSEGETYEIDFSINERGNVVYRDIKAARHITPFGHQSKQAPRQQPQPRSAPVLDKPSTPQNGNGQHYRPTHPRDARRMFLCAQVSAAITSRSIPLTREAIAGLIAELSAAYDVTIGMDDPQEIG